MAQLSKIKTNLTYQLRHNARETANPSNKEIDPERSGENYYLTPESHGRTAAECKEYYEKRLSEIYRVDSSRLVTACSWVVTAPKDLDPSQEREFFEASYRFITEICGGEDACIQAVVHCDEKIRGPDGGFAYGANHMHLVFIPEVANKKFITKQDKFKAGIKEAVDKYDLPLDKIIVQDLYRVVNRYEDSTSKNRERDAIRSFSSILHLKRDDARWVFTRCRRLESERYEKRACYDDLITRQFLLSFHPRFQKHIESSGLHCTVHSGVTGGRSRSVEELKRETKEQLLVEANARVKDLTIKNEKLSTRIKELEKQISYEHSWGEASNWGQSKENEITWTR